LSLRVIATGLGRATSTVSRELLVQAALALRAAQVEHLVEPLSRAAFHGTALAPKTHVPQVAAT
jgi:hypothetical protein